jgi:hypothetical protein
MRQPAGEGAEHCTYKMLQLEHSASMFQLEHTGDLQLYVQAFRLGFCAECSSWNILKWEKLLA